MSLARLWWCSVVCVAFIAAPGSFAASIEITNLRTFSIPFGDRVTQVAINDNGDIAGTSFLTRTNSSQSGFVIPANGTPPIQVKNPAAQYTLVNGINNAGTLAGYYFGNDNLIHGFTYSAGTYTPVDVASYTYLFDINNKGDLTGYYSNIGISATGFLIQGGSTVTFALPGYPLDTFGTGLNDSDQVVGYFGSVQSGFLRQSDGSFQTFDFPAQGINNSGIIVGNGGGPNNTSLGMVRIGGTEYTFSFPGATNTYLDGINNANQVVGIYEDATFAAHIFEGQLVVPEPSTACLCGSALILGAILVFRFGNFHA